MKRHLPVINKKCRNFWLILFMVVIITLACGRWSFSAPKAIRTIQQKLTSETPEDYEGITEIFTEAPQPGLVKTTEVDCALSFERRELHEPYNHQKNGEARFTLSEEELSAYLGMMGIESFCIPSVLGAPFINVDWGSETSPAVQGRMISIGFEDLYQGSGWSDGYLLYSTYDFKTGSEYDTFAKPRDYLAVLEGSIPETFEVDGVKGFTRIQQGLSYGAVPYYKAYIFPFEVYYVALIYGLGTYEDDFDAVLTRLQAGEFLPETKEGVELFRYMSRSFQFK
jgi:hypothetical protein